MYDINKFKHGEIVTVGEVIDALSQFNRDAEFLLDGCDDVYIHCNDEESMVNISPEMLIEDYDDYDPSNDDELYNKLSSYNFGGSLYKDMIQVKVIGESGKELSRLIREEDYNNNSLGVLPVYHSYLKSADPNFSVDRDQLIITGTRFSYFKGWHEYNVDEEKNK